MTLCLHTLHTADSHNELEDMDSHRSRVMGGGPFFSTEKGFFNELRSSDAEQGISFIMTKVHFENFSYNFAPQHVFLAP